jgi:hypothetical protein
MSKLDKVQRPTIKATRKTKVKLPPRGMAAPNLDTMFDPVEGISVYDLPDMGDPEQNIDQEISAALAAVLDERKRRRELFRVQMDADFYFSVCFQTTEQKEDFLKQAGWFDLGTDYLDGLQVASRMNIDIEPIMLPRPATARTPVKLRETELIELPESLRR